MRCLWLTWIDPTPAHDGQRIYSGRLIEAFAAAGAELEVLCGAHRHSARRDGDVEGRVTWRLAGARRNAAWQSVLSDLPHVVHRSATREMRARFKSLLRREPWDCVVLDGLYAGWALALLQAAAVVGRARPRLVYVAHNHETTMRADLAANMPGRGLARLYLKSDARKVAGLEREIVAAADLVTAITSADAAKFAAERPGRPTIVLTPGYAEGRVAARRIDETIPRRAAIVGSFEWIAKQANLEAFLAVADPLFAAAGAELIVVGNGRPEFLRALARKTAATRFVGEVSRVEPYLGNARLAILPERLGGGFKLKILTYVFNRVPIATLESCLAGTPLAPGDSVLAYGDYGSLARGAVAALDDLTLLDAVQTRAYAACDREFDWASRGERLRASIAALAAAASEPELPDLPDLPGLGEGALPALAAP